MNYFGFMTEALLHYIWKLRLFNADNLLTKSGEVIEIIHQGFHNHDSGPDFLNAKIRIGKNTWAGNVELHVNGNEWYQHKHQQDDAYNNVILHVVMESKEDFVTAKNAATIPCLELKGRINEQLLSRYEALMRAATSIPCANSIKQVDSFVIDNAIERNTIERLERKVNAIVDMLHASNGDWEHTAWQMIARYLGSGVNRDPMEQVVKQIPVSVLSKHADNALQIEAMVFGVSGLLKGDFADDYPRQLQKEFNYLKRFHSLNVLEPGVFRWAKIRPANFPTVRLAQLAAVMMSDVKIFSRLLKCESIKEIESLFLIKPNVYWQNHYRFDEVSEKGVGKIGATTIAIIAINAIVPLLFAYGKHKGEESFCDKAVSLLQSIDAEVNVITKTFGTFNIAAQSAFQSQGMVQLKQNYCNNFRCLDCGIGNAILKV